MFVDTLMNIHGCQNTFLVIDSLVRIPDNLLHQTDHKVVFFLDCFGLVNPELDMLVRSVPLIIKPKRMYALFNLVAEANFEKKALQYGVRGFFYQNDTPDNFCKGTRAILDGEVWASRKVSSEILLETVLPAEQLYCPYKAIGQLTNREKEVLAHLANGATSKDIASALFISPHTLRTHVYNIYRKINVHNRVQASHWAKKNF